MEETSDPSCRNIKVILVGDSECGKTALLNAYVRNQFNEKYEATVFNSLSTAVEVDGERIELTLWDTSGHEDYDHVRPLSYNNVDIVLICFDISRPKTADSILEKWIIEVCDLCPNKPVLLVGCKQDLRSEVNIVSKLASKVCQQPVTSLEGRKLADRICALDYIECSSKTMDFQLEKVFEMTTLAAINKLNNHRKSRRRKQSKSERACVSCLIS
ncbi:predicted protein [Nematostella vectensis]|uniref:Uncharacterized protein n=1 Tax=Nematostella vectensis TaxID=45351 RepID=A7S215_NEMVE|nr:transforming protein RhoA [Nematostella vectensis]EDO42207.1 predicted protein [Nematostella vectensis]|eukprot:XP_001634270.1 predicted protein [Nematostella vectensis]